MFHCRDLVNYGMLALVGVYFLLFPTPLGMENDIILKILGYKLGKEIYFRRGREMGGGANLVGKYTSV